MNQVCTIRHFNLGLEKEDYFLSILVVELEGSRSNKVLVPSSWLQKQQKFWSAASSFLTKNSAMHKLSVIITITISVCVCVCTCVCVWVHMNAWCVFARQVFACAGVWQWKGKRMINDHGIQTYKTWHVRSATSKNNSEEILWEGGGGPWTQE